MIGPIGPAGPNDAAMFDIDDTLLFLDGTPNIPIIEILFRMKDLGYKIVIITARPHTTLNVKLTKTQLQNNGIYYDHLGFTTPETKGDMKLELGYNFILSVGDQWTDWTHSKYYIDTNTSNASHNYGTLQTRS